MSISKNIYSFIFLLFVTASLQAQTPTAGGQQATAIPLSADAVSPLEEGNKIPPITLATPEGESSNLNVFTVCIQVYGIQ